MLKNGMRPVHPGEILSEDYIRKIKKEMNEQ
jgi:plasmid maintenance system antidote protein VapI